MGLTQPLDRKLDLEGLFRKYGVEPYDSVTVLLDVSCGCVAKGEAEAVVSALKEASQNMRLAVGFIAFSSRDKVDFSATYTPGTIDSLTFGRWGGGPTYIGPALDEARRLNMPGKTFIITDGYFYDRFDPSGLDVVLVMIKGWSGCIIHNTPEEFLSLQRDYV